MPAPKDLIHESSTTTGTGDFTLTAVNGKVRFSDSTYAFGTGVSTDVFDYFISNRDAAEWERGTGHMSDANTLVRDTVIASSNSNNAVSFSAGTKDVTNDVPAGAQARGAGTVTDGHAVLFDGTTGSLLKSAGFAPVLCLASGSVSGAAAMDISLTGLTAYKVIKIFVDVMPATDNVSLYLRFSTDGGSSFDATGYNYSGSRQTDIGSLSAIQSGSANEILIGDAIGNAATEGYHGEVTLMSQTNAALWTKARYHGYYITASATPAGAYIVGGGARETAQDTDAVRFVFSSGNITGSYRVVGMI